jgi:hypothetical protein
LKKVNLIAVTLAMAMGALTAVPACAAVEVQITDASGTRVYTGTSCGANCTYVTASDSDASFSIDIQLGSSDLIDGLPSLTVGGIVYANYAGSLAVAISNTDFTAPLGSAELTQTIATQSPGSSAATGSITAQGFYGTGSGNEDFCTNSNNCTGGTPSVSLSSLDVTNPGVTSSAAVNFASSYSLDEVLDYAFTGAGWADAAANLSVAPSVAPEPASEALVGITLLGAGILFRRKKKSTRA